MFKEILVNNRAEDVRAAVIEDGMTAEIYMERKQSQHLVGNIFKGRVENVLPGMQAAFVDVGLEKNAFLYIEDALPARHSEGNNGSRDYSGIGIGDILKRGQELLVQVAKEHTGAKGPRVTTHITLPGRYAVLTPMIDYVGVSRRINGEKERERLKELARLVKPENMGVIVRTVAEGVEEDEFRQDINIINELWQKTLRRSSQFPAPYLAHRDLDLALRVIRDFFTEDVDRLMIDSRHDYESVLDLLDVVGPHLKQKVFLEEDKDLFAYYGVEHEIDRALKRKVWLKNGGYLIIDQTEALTVIDVNTGKFVGTTNLEDTVLKTNLEAAKEVVRHLRLRNIGGIIIIDFIDMCAEDNRSAVLKLLEEEIKKDRTKTNVLGLTRLGLVEMTRKKTWPSLSEVLQKPCSQCGGQGRVGA